MDSVAAAVMLQSYLDSRPRAGRTNATRLENAMRRPCSCFCLPVCMLALGIARGAIHRGPVIRAACVKPEPDPSLAILRQPPLGGRTADEAARRRAPRRSTSRYSLESQWPSIADSTGAGGHHTRPMDTAGLPDLYRTGYQHPGRGLQAERQDVRDRSLPRRMQDATPTQVQIRGPARVAHRRDCGLAADFRP